MFEFIDMAINEATIPLSGAYIPDAAECLRCGMCVSVCPTFRLQPVNEETPRSRLRTISNVLQENQTISDEQRQHLDNCLQCRACEVICPSKMAYGQLFDQTQAALKKTTVWPARLGFWLIANKSWRLRLLPLLSFYLKSGLQKPLRHSGLLKKLHLAEAEALLAKPALGPLASCYPNSGKMRGQVALFTGCLSEAFDRATLQAAITLLNAMGYTVIIPPQQSCCGAIHQHNGQNAAHLIANNLKVFNALSVDAVLYTATGCGAMLSEYQSDTSAEAVQFKNRIQDINAFLLQHWPDNLQLQASAQKVAVHEPCSQRNVLKNQHTVYALLQKIPDLDVTPLADNALCCGAGGSYLLSHPDNAAQLRALKHEAMHNAESEVIVSSNYGCAMFIQTDTLSVVHPLVLLARQLPG